MRLSDDNKLSTFVHWKLGVSFYSAVVWLVVGIGGSSFALCQKWGRCVILPPAAIEAYKRMYLRVFRSLWVHNCCTFSMACAKCCRQVMRFAAAEEEGEAAKLVPKESERENKRPMRFKTTSLLLDGSPSEEPREREAKLKHAVSVFARWWVELGSGWSQNFVWQQKQNSRSHIWKAYITYILYWESCCFLSAH